MSIPVPLAYEYHHLTFCPGCAYQSSLIGFLLARQPLPKNMDEVIASLALIQVENNAPIVTPVATMLPSKPACDNCGHEFKTHKEEVA